MYDRLNGSTMMIISSAGTTVPGSPTRPEFLKASVYLPPSFVAHHPDLHSHIMDIVQHYIETVGVRTVTLWSQRARRDLHYSLNQPGNPCPIILMLFQNQNTTLRISNSWDSPTGLQTTHRPSMFEPHLQWPQMGHTTLVRTQTTPWLHSSTCSKTTWSFKPRLTPCSWK